MTTPADLPWASSYPPAVDWAGAIPSYPLYQILDDATHRFGDRPCIDFMGKIYSYKQVSALVARAAKGLQKMGVRKGTAVAVILPNTPFYMIAYFAILKIGGVVVNFNPLYAEKEIAHQLEDSGAKIAITLDMPMMLDKLKPLLQAGTIKHIIVGRMVDILPMPLSLVYRFLKFRDMAKIPQDAHYTSFENLMNNDGRFDNVLIDAGRDLAVLQYTGGTTGVPKGACLTHANLTANAMQSRMVFPHIAMGEERMLGVIPFFHVFAMTAVMNFTILIGGMIIMLPRFNLVQVVKVIDKKHPTLFPAVPTIYTAINSYKNLSSYNLKSIKYCISGGAPLPVEVKRDFEKLTGCVLVEGYGLSETSPVASCNPVEGVNKAGSIGLPVPGTFIEIVSLEDGKSLMPSGERGEVCIIGPQVMAGYWNKPDENAKSLTPSDRGMRFHTGDIGYMDGDGYTFIVDRIKDMIMAGGFKIYPRHVEEAIYQHPSVEECIVAGVPDKYRGETVKAWIKLRQGQALTKDALNEFLKTRLSTIEMPKLIEFRDNPLPKTMIGKLSRKMVLEEEKAKG